MEDVLTPAINCLFVAEMFTVSLPSQHGLRSYKLEIESTKTLLVDCDPVAAGHRGEVKLALVKSLFSGWFGFRGRTQLSHLQGVEGIPELPAEAQKKTPSSRLAKEPLK